MLYVIFFLLFMLTENNLPLGLANKEIFCILSPSGIPVM